MEILTKQQLKKFMDDRPLLTPAGLSKEAGLAEATIRKLFSEKDSRKLTKYISDKLLPVMKKYGYQ